MKCLPQILFSHAYNEKEAIAYGIINVVITVVFASLVLYIYIYKQNMFNVGYYAMHDL